MFTQGEKVVIREVPWKGVVGTYVRKGWFLFLRVHFVEVGDIVSGGTPRIVRVMKLRALEEVAAKGRI